MFKCYDNTKLKNEILKCDQCNLPFDEYCQPKFLPCFKTICTTCELTIHKKAINKRFKCGVCEKDHFIPDDGFVIDETKFSLISAELMEISRGENYERLQNNLNKVFSIVKLFCSDYENGNDVIKEFCNEQIRLIQLSTENKIEQINKLSDELIAFVKEYERMCIESYSNKSMLIKEDIKNTIQEANTFLNEKQAYLQKYKIDDEEIKEFNKTSEELQLDLNGKLKKLKSLIFNGKLIKFLSNSREINKFELGNFEYEILKEPTKVFSGSADCTIKLWDLESCECIKTFVGHNNSVVCIRNVLDDKLISGSYDGSIKIWKIETGECLKTINAHTTYIQNIVLISNDRFVTCSGDKTIKLFDLNTYECIRTFIGHEGIVYCIEKLLNNKIISCSRDKTIRMWDLYSAECLKILRGHVKSASSLAVISDDKIISGSKSEIKVWDVESGECLQTLNVGHTNYIISILKISNEKIIVSVSADQNGKLIILNINDGETLQTISAHPLSIWSLSKLSSNKIISCSSDKTIKVWNIDTGICLKTLEGHSSSVYGLDLLN